MSLLRANLYVRRFALAWRDHGHQDQLNAHVVNHADDFVICCRPGKAGEAMTRMGRLMARLGLEVNEAKTRIARLPEDALTFLGYTLGRIADPHMLRLIQRWLKAGILADGNVEVSERGTPRAR